ncbi:DUF2945 domain-containing protein [Alteromonas sp. ASW11-19]|uniref:DUF2945 domain-containing protein n=1 Tax=Alteromonas salexigens TaxID=2982530 RepID=A0ABT2VIV3_9ALTE|nr:DUF2945 domain-containing protein [Alteromonas salexigens]MCU7553105.1 DUF2945 domain-containing protein [Alteromonas salexigens]
MSNAYQTNTEVEWEWGNGYGTGYVREIFREKITRTLQGEEVTRKGSDDNPAYVIEQADGDKVLKLHSELEQANA